MAEHQEELNSLVPPSSRRKRAKQVESGEKDIASPDQEALSKDIPELVVEEEALKVDKTVVRGPLADKYGNRIGDSVIYWMANPDGYLEPNAATLTQVANDKWQGVRYRAVMGGCYAVSAMIYSEQPKIGCFTKRDVQLTDAYEMLPRVA